jgi:hypothetical protein
MERVSFYYGLIDTINGTCLQGINIDRWGGRWILPRYKQGIKNDRVLLKRNEVASGFATHVDGSAWTSIKSFTF